MSLGQPALPRTAILAVGASAAVLFSLEPFVGKVLLPNLGGTPAVWNTCVMVFQALLLGGYWYAVALLKVPNTRSAVAIHMTVAAGSALLWPIGLSALWWAPPAGWPPVLWLAGVLLVGIGPPFVILSATSPIVQVLVARQSPQPLPVHRLYAVSNVASVAGLVFYLAVVETFAGVRAQRLLLWAAYAITVIVTIVAVRPRGQRPESGVQGPESGVQGPESEVQGPESGVQNGRARWMMLSFGASLLLYAVNTYLTTDIASFPLLWCVPLATFLLAFAAGFSAWAERHRTGLTAAARWTALGATAHLVWFIDHSLKAVDFAVPVVALAVVVAALGAALAAARPEDERLPAFYTFVGVGGVAAGVASVIVVPWLWSAFSSDGWPVMSRLAGWLQSRSSVILTHPVPEYAAALTLGLVLLSRDHTARGLWRWALAGAVALTLTVAAERLLTRDGLSAQERWGIAGAAVVVAAAVASHPLRLAAAAVAMALAGGIAKPADYLSVFEARNFFGTLRVQLDAGSGTRRLKHGSTLHGLQPAGSDADQPVSYYGPDGPIGQVMHHLQPRRVVVVGLGTGTMAAYGRAGDEYLFLEINPLVARIANTREWFSYLDDARARGVSVSTSIGDGRLLAHGLEDGAWDLIVMDAFTSDAVPIHLLTVEAMQLFFRKLSPRGVLAYHISNRYFDLRPAIAAGAEAISAAWRVAAHSATAPHEFSSTWVMLTRSGASAAAAGLMGGEWEQPEFARRVLPWTDDHANVIGALKVKWR